MIMSSVEQELVCYVYSHISGSNCSAHVALYTTTVAGPGTLIINMTIMGSQSYHAERSVRGRVLKEIVLWPVL